MAKKTFFKHKGQGLYHARALDIAVRVTLGLFFAFSAGAYIRNASASLHGADMAQFDAVSLWRGLSVFAAGLYTLLIACLYALRLRPVNKFPGLWPSLAAVLGGFLMFALVWLPPRTDLPPGTEAGACFLVLIGNIFAAYVLARLGRSFSILPESRKLVVTGPYRFVRHPLYVAEAIASIGTMILFLSPVAVALVMLQTAFQLVRIHYEEKILSENFPDYKKYAKATARLIPGIY